MFACCIIQTTSGSLRPVSTETSAFGPSAAPTTLQKECPEIIHASTLTLLFFLFYKSDELFPANIWWIIYDCITQRAVSQHERIQKALIYLAWPTSSDQELLLTLSMNWHWNVCYASTWGGSVNKTHIACERVQFSDNLDQAHAGVSLSNARMKLTSATWALQSLCFSLSPPHSRTHTPVSHKWFPWPQLHRINQVFHHVGTKCLSCVAFSCLLSALQSCSVFRCNQLPHVEFYDNSTKEWAENLPYDVQESITTSALQSYSITPDWFRCMLHDAVGIWFCVMSVFAFWDTINVLRHIRRVSLFLFSSRGELFRWDANCVKRFEKVVSVLTNAYK